jgi:aerobic C4-dicarboxylate transport protein
LALILGIDRFMSESRSLTNFIGNGVAAIVVARWENELDLAKLTAELNGRPTTPVPEAAEASRQLADL